MRTSWRVLAFAGALMGCGEPVPTSTGIEFLDARDALAVGSDAAILSAGRSIYHDADLSRNRNQACATCHAAEWGFAGPGDGSWPTFNGGFAFFAGSFDGRTPSTVAALYGGRKPPSAAYTSFSPTLAWFAADNAFRGGLFWDGRATGDRFTSPDVGKLIPIQQQALGPFQAAPEHAFSQVCVLNEIRQSEYKQTFDMAAGVSLDALAWNKVDVWMKAQVAELAKRGVTLAPPAGSGSVTELDRWCHSTTQDPTYQAMLLAMPTNFNAAELTAFTLAYNSVGFLVGRFEASPEVEAFRSPYDGNALTTSQRTGEALFFGEAGCAFCHATIQNGVPATGRQQVFSDFSYYNIGLPRNPSHPNPSALPDPGLGGFLATAIGRTFNTSGRPASDFNGFFRTATVRNVDKRKVGGAKTYMHNGVLTSLEQVVHFYNTRDLKACPAGVIPKAFPIAGNSPKKDLAQGRCWPAPEINNQLVRNLLDIAAPGDLAVVPRGPIGDIGLTAAEEAALVAFMKALSDR